MIQHLGTLWASGLERQVDLPGCSYRGTLPRALLASSRSGDHIASNAAIAITVGPPRNTRQLRYTTLQQASTCTWLRGVGGHSSKHATGRVPEAQCAFKILMIHEVLQFALRIAFRCVLHRCRSLDIRR